MYDVHCQQKLATQHTQGLRHHYQLITTMKSKKSLIVVVIIFVLFHSCSKREENLCLTDLGQLNWSNETEAWFSDMYLNLSSSLIFENGSGDQKEFAPDKIEITEGVFVYFDMECQETGEMIHVRFATRSLGGRFISQDSIAIDFSMRVVNEKVAIPDMVEADFYDRIGVSIHRLDDGTPKTIGRVSIISDIKNSELEEIQYQQNVFTLNDELILRGIIFKDVFSNEDFDFPNSNIYFQKGVGVIAFKDESGELWIKK